MKVPKIAVVLGVLFIGVLFIGVLFIGLHVMPALADRGRPPLACELAGGQWNIWNGWTCP